jgi:hypothetical protein
MGSCYANHAYKLLISHFQGVFFFGVELVAKHVHAVQRCQICPTDFVSPPLQPLLNSAPELRGHCSNMHATITVIQQIQRLSWPKII